MITLREAIDSKHPIVITSAIEQRKVRRRQLYDLIKRWEKSFMERSIRATQGEILLLEQRLERELRQQAGRDTLLARLQSDREQLTKEIAALKAHVPKDDAGRLAKQFASLDMSKEDIIRLVERVLNARSVQKETTKD